MHERKRVVFLSFSGIDGAGKSSQIAALGDYLAEAGLTVSTLSMWDDVVVGSQVRETASGLAFRGDQGVGSPERPVRRRDKNVTYWPLHLLRLILYFSDAVNLRRIVRRLRSGETIDVVIFDRYIYDELANLPLNDPIARSFVSLVLRMVPKPDVAYLIDVDPAEALARKPEYPLDFLRNNRERYLALSAMGGLEVIKAASIQECHERVRAIVLPRISSMNICSSLVAMPR